MLRFANYRRAPMISCLTVEAQDVDLADVSSSHGMAPRVYRFSRRGEGNCMSLISAATAQLAQPHGFKDPSCRVRHVHQVGSDRYDSGPLLDRG